MAELGGTLGGAFFSMPFGNPDEEVIGKVAFELFDPIDDLSLKLLLALNVEKVL